MDKFVIKINQLQTLSTLLFSKYVWRSLQIYITHYTLNNNKGIYNLITCLPTENVGKFKITVNQGDSGMDEQECLKLITDDHGKIRANKLANVLSRLSLSTGIAEPSLNIVPRRRNVVSINKFKRPTNTKR